MITIHKRYEVIKNNKKYYVQQGVSSGIPTKWITLKPWDDCVVFLSIIDGQFVYRDSRGNHMTVFDRYAKEWADFI